ncbi:MTAP family purine nucleoside phosphorylase [Candidatus Woesearchaeota archaeon]|nr:MTAP family purine nucleoside phosphorylase [Candidatus Woesearchaeota archaeon]
MGLVAIIGGSGVEDSPSLEGAVWNKFDTGYASGLDHHTGVVWYKKKDEVIFIPRHGGHPQENPRFGPAKTQYAANLIAAHALGARVVVATSAVGSLHGERIGVGSLVIPDDYIDQSGRSDNLFGEGIVVHNNPIPAFSVQLRSILIHHAQEKEEKFNGIHTAGTYLVIPGDRFGTKAEGLRRAQYADIVGMTICPEASFAQQLGLHYAVVAFPVDVNLDANHEGGTIEVMKRMSVADKVPDYVSRVVNEACNTQFGLVDGLKGNIIPGNTARISNRYLRAAADELVQIYCRK